MLKEDHTFSVAILQYSSNVGMVQVMQRIKPADYGWLERWAKQTIGIDLPSEVPGQLKSQKQFIVSN